MVTPNPGIIKLEQALTLLGPGVDLAQEALADLQGPPPGPTAVLTPNSGPAGSVFNVKLSHFPPDTPVHIHFDRSPREAPTTDSQGNLDEHVTVPSPLLPGDYPVHFILRGSEEALVTAIFTVTAVPADLVTNLVAKVGDTVRPYELDILQLNTKPFIDRNHIFDLVPSGFRGEVLVRTANEDRDKPLTLAFTLTREAVVYVLFDGEVVDADLPSWLQDWTKNTGSSFKVSTNENRNSGDRRTLSKTFPAGEVVLGAAGMNPNSGTNYNVVVKE